jgi:hypothetical protein
MRQGMNVMTYIGSNLIITYMVLLYYLVSFVVFVVVQVVVFVDVYVLIVLMSSRQIVLPEFLLPDQNVNVLIRYPTHRTILCHVGYDVTDVIMPALQLTYH